MAAHSEATFRADGILPTSPPLARTGPLKWSQTSRAATRWRNFKKLYDDLRNKLIARGIPAEEIAYIHSARNTEKGTVWQSPLQQVLNQLTQKMGAVQKKLVALHHLELSLAA